MKIKEKFLQFWNRKEIESKLVEEINKKARELLEEIKKYIQEQKEEEEKQELIEQENFKKDLEEKLTILKPIIKNKKIFAKVQEILERTEDNDILFIELLKIYEE